MGLAIKSLIERIPRHIKNNQRGFVLFYNVHLFVSSSKMFVIQEIASALIAGVIVFIIDKKRL